MANGIRRFSLCNGSVAAAIILIFTFVVILCPKPAEPALAPDLAIIEATELNSHREAWTILDTRAKSEWPAGHIAGSRLFSWEDFIRTDEKGVPFRLMPLPDIAGALGKMGIDENAPIAIYGDADKSWGGEGWACWVLAWLGHKGPIRLLAGGIQSWRAQGYPISADSGQPESSARSYQFSLRPELDISTAELEAKGDSVVVIDCRSTTEWLLGHVPGAIHIQWTEFYSGKERRPLDANGLKKLFQANKVDMSKPIVYYCTGGVRSGFAWTIHQLCGLPQARNYNGGIEAWKRRTSR
jgi:thiosulfate/3-mercaptopyruvate sulfurtransferase